MRVTIRVAETDRATVTMQRHMVARQSNRYNAETHGRQTERLLSQTVVTETCEWRQSSFRLRQKVWSSW